MTRRLRKSISNGELKACPSLPTAPYVGGNVLDTPLEEIWGGDRPEIRFARDRTIDELWGFCATCYYNETCMGGCSWTAHCTLGRRGNNPFCYHRVTELKKQRDAVAKEVPADALAILEELIARRGDDAMAHVEVLDRRNHEWTCGACMMALPVQTASASEPCRPPSPRGACG